MPFVIPAPPQVSVPVTGTDRRFPVRRIFCVGRNYADHALEMGGDPDKEPPFFFAKPADALVDSGATIPYPPATADFHFEAELVVALHAGGAFLAEEDTAAMIYGHAAGNDLTRRDLQAQAKAARRPWDMAKGFDASAVIGAIRPGALPANARMTCTVNGTTRQDTALAAMVWNVPGILAHLSRLVRLAPGDLVFTGTPAGVGALLPGDTCTVRITGLPEATVSIA